MEDVKVINTEERETTNNTLLALSELLTATVPNQNGDYESIWTVKESKIIRDAVLKLVKEL